MADWYLKRGAKVSGPYEKSRIKELASTGKLRRDDQLATSPNGPFRPAGEVPGLLPSADEEDLEVLQPVEEDRPRPRRKKSRRKSSGSGNQVIIAVVCAALLLCGCPVGIALLLPAIEQGRMAARRAQSKNNLLTQIRATRAHIDEKGVFPATSRNQRNRQSIHTQLLPFLDQQALFQRVVANQPWDAPVNLGPMSTEVSAYLNPAVEERSVNGLGAVHYAGNQWIFSGTRGVSPMFIFDGLSTTMVMGEVRTRVKPWGDPANLRDPLTGLGDGPLQFNPGPTGWQAAFADGSVRHLSPDTDARVMRAIGTPSGGENFKFGD